MNLHFLEINKYTMSVFQVSLSLLVFSLIFIFLLASEALVESYRLFSFFFAVYAHWLADYA